MTYNCILKSQLSFSDIIDTFSLNCLNMFIEVVKILSQNHYLHEKCMYEMSDLIEEISSQHHQIYKKIMYKINFPL